MKKEQSLKKNLDNNDNVINFEGARKALLTGGPTIDENWLKAMKPGTVFLCRPKNQPKDVLILSLFAVLEHKTVASSLAQKAPDGRQIEIWVRSLEFSRQHDWVETIAEVDFTSELQKEQGKPVTENADGNSSGSV